jgi:hypothetical protein
MLVMGYFKIIAHGAHGKEHGLSRLNFLIIPSVIICNLPRHQCPILFIKVPHYPVLGAGSVWT